MCKVNTGYHGTSEIEHGLCARTVDNPLAKARGLSLRTGAQTMPYLLAQQRRNRKPLKYSRVDGPMKSDRINALGGYVKVYGSTSVFFFFWGGGRAL